MMASARVPPGPGQESVWDYPRPPRVEETSRRVQVTFGGLLVAETTAAKRVLETSHPPVYYIPPEDVRRDVLRPAGGGSECEWKGAASYFDLVAGDGTVPRSAWTYAQPSQGFEAIRDHVAVYPGRLDRCTVDGEVVEAQPGDFYGGWITSRVTGPFKGAPGTSGW
jgi:uncharacterized protein (DUF427 family)